MGWPGGTALREGKRWGWGNRRWENQKISETRVERLHGELRSRNMEKRGKGRELERKGFKKETLRSLRRFLGD